MKKQIIAEFLGTFFLVFVGTGAIIVNEITGSLTHIGVSLVFGLIVMALIYTLGHISGAHLNPVVTISFLVYGDFTIKDSIKYITAQILGAVAASSGLLFMFGNIANLGATLPKNSWQQAFVLEFILTFLLVLVIMGSAVHGKAIKSFSGIAIGAAVALEAMFGGPISGASMNPARSIGPAIVSGNINNLWIYIIATILGGIVATVVYKYIHE
ncbi:MAG: MIP family channel protein [Clostridiaceae bacterium]|nr:MIP family channel protein [Clostridiaceae bacterium]